MLIRPEEPLEFDAIYALVKTAFETAKVADGDEQEFVNRLRSGSGYIPELALVAEKNGRLIGHIMLTKFDIPGYDGALLLAPLCVTLENRRQGVGAMLVQTAFDWARELEYKAVVLVGDPAYYGRFGFVRSTDFGIENADGIPGQFVLAFELQPHALKGVSGKISFPK